MPSQRKRIGFLPSSEVQNIINKISLEKKISQSKVTGILVEEALSQRSNRSNSNSINLKDEDKNENLFINPENELELIKEYLDYKRFKKLFLKAKKDHEK